MASQPAKRQRVQAGSGDAHSSQRGQIARISLHNFMSYTDAEIRDPGSKLNCIVGPNGTGKSSIVCAMCVGLGGPLKVTERGDSISCCLHGEGKTKDRHGNLIERGYVETELVDGNGPGDNLVVRLDFDVRGKKQWTMNGAQTTEKKVKDAMASLNIQVDNPLQFLPQDKVGQFSNLSPEMLLKHTEMAIGPDVYDKHMRLIEADKDVGEVKQRLTSEQQTLDDELEKQAKLQKDVDRWNAYQENLKKLKQMQGKVLWIRAAIHEEKLQAAMQQYEEQKATCKELKTRRKQAEQREKPLEDDKKAMHEEAQAINSSMKKLDEKRIKLGQEAEELEEQAANMKDSLGKVDRSLARLVANRNKIQTEIDFHEAEKTQINTESMQEFGEDLAAVERELSAAMTRANEANHFAEDGLSEHNGKERELQRRAHMASKDVSDLSNAELAKQTLVKQHHANAARCAAWLEADATGQSIAAEVIGPLLMDIEVAKKDDRKLVENAISDKYLFGFVVKSERARDTLLQQISSNHWGLNVYRHTGTFAPIARPDSKELKKWGVTGWLDEALHVPLDKRNNVLGCLKDMASIDRMLLGTDAAAQHFEEIQTFLRGKGIQSFRLYMPSRTIAAEVSQYGQKNAGSVSSIPKQERKLFDNTVDSKKKAELEAAKKEAEGALKAHAKELSQLQTRKGQAEEELTQAKQRKEDFAFRKRRISSLDAQLVVKGKKLSDEQRKVDAFDVDAKKAEYKGQLGQLMGQQLGKTAEMAQLIAQLAPKQAAKSAAMIAVKVAAEALEAAKERNQELRRQSEEAERQKDALKTQAHALANQGDAMQQQARAEAPELEAGPDGQRSAEAEAIWRAYPDDEASLEGEIDSLQEETDGANADSSSMRDFERRARAIEEMRGRLGETRNHLEERQDVVVRLQAEWKPSLEQMITQVNDNFAMYFQRFRCCGEVHLSDGRKLNEAGQPEGPDDFSQYKIHIKVQWRATEQLHVLGEGGRDSGGERSVATMVYLISLQNINPAPFRVVDEINQAMDSTNERNIFECITHACNEGGKQYFLLTPKLLPDLPYGEDTVVQLVFNGPWMEPKERFNLKAFC